MLSPGVRRVSRASRRGSLVSQPRPSQRTGQGRVLSTVRPALAPFATAMAASGPPQTGSVHVVSPALPVSSRVTGEYWGGRSWASEQGAASWRGQPQAGVQQAAHPAYSLRDAEDDAFHRPRAAGPPGAVVQNERMRAHPAATAARAGSARLPGACVPPPPAGRAGFLWENSRLCSLPPPLRLSPSVHHRPGCGCAGTTRGGGLAGIRI